MNGSSRGEEGIRTPDQRLRVFVSSTLAELAEERRIVSDAISSLRLTPVLFEQGARPHPPRDLFRAYLHQSDVFIGLYWQSYGRVSPGMEVSGLEEEFELSRELPRLLYIKEPAPDREPRLTELLSQMRPEASYRRFRSSNELDQLVRDDLATLLSERFVARREPSHTPPGQDSLPVDATSLIGRGREVEEVASLIELPEVRLVTLTGPGGVGKTRLAVAVGERLRDRFEAGTVFVPLETVTDSEQVSVAIGRAVDADLRGTGSALVSVVERLADDPWLLILDNLEQAHDAAHDIDQLLMRCPGVAVLATSRLTLQAARRAGVSGDAVAASVGTRSRLSRSAGVVAGGGPLCRPGPCGAPRLQPYRGQRRRCGRDLPAPGGSAAGDRTGGGSHPAA